MSKINLFTLYYTWLKKKIRIRLSGKPSLYELFLNFRACDRRTENSTRDYGTAVW